ncbi:MAG TPA: YXWGXW repeat-containing protein, partial [Polyangiaceae bacterium]
AASSTPSGADPAGKAGNRLALLSTVRVGSALAMLSVACGGGLPVPAYTRQPSSEYLPVPYPPPAGFSEVVPPIPRKEARWIDGHWVWRDSTYVWQRGGWVLPPKGASVAPWQVRYTRDGTLLFADEIWYDAQSKPIASPEPLLPAYTPPNVLTPESQHGF